MQCVLEGWLRCLSVKLVTPTSSENKKFSILYPQPSILLNVVARRQKAKYPFRIFRPMLHVYFVS